MNESEPTLILLGQVLPNRVAPIEALAHEMPIEVVDLANDVPHGGGHAALPDSVPQRQVSLRDIPALIRSGRYRAVMIETQGAVSFPLAALAARFTRTPLVLWMGIREFPRTFRWWFGRRILRLVLRQAVVVVTYSDPQTHFAEALGARKIIKSVNPVDLDFWSEDANVVRSSGLRFLFSGRADQEKGPHVLLEAWRQGGFAERGATLLMIGGGDWEPRGGYPDGVERGSFLDRKGMRSIYAGTDVLVVPSITTRTFKEPWGMVIGEAMCQSVSVIATDSVGAVAAGLASDGETALVVPEGDPEALSDAMAKLERDEDLRNRLASAGRERVEGFGPGAWVRDMGKAVEIARR